MGIDDAMADRQAQAGPLAGAAARKERLEDVLHDVGTHAAAGVLEGQLDLAVTHALAHREASPLLHAVQGVDDEVEEDLLDFLAVDPGGDALLRLEDQLFAFVALQVLHDVEDALDQFADVGRLAFAFAAAAKGQELLRDFLTAERLLLNHLQILVDDLAL